MSSHLGFENEEGGIFQFAINADFNILKSLYSESELLDDSDRRRTTQSFIFRSAYSIKNDLTLEAFIPFVRQTRRIYGVSGVNDESTLGIGDPILLLNYEVVKSPVSLSFGSGIQFPLGSYTKRNSRGLFLVEDLQPGSGAFDLIFMSSIRFSTGFRPTLKGYFNTIFSSNGVNPTSRGGLQSYKFGNDIQVILGAGDQIFLGNQIFTPGVALRYRSAKRDEIDAFPSSGTGGRFLFLRLSNGWSVTPNSTVTINLELPLYIRVNETQLAPTVNFNIGYYSRFNIKQNRNEG